MRDYYKSEGMEAIDVIDEFFYSNAYRANIFKYIARAGKKSPDTEVEDLEKARDYLTWEIAKARHRRVRREESDKDVDSAQRA